MTRRSGGVGGFRPVERVAAVAPVRDAVAEAVAEGCAAHVVLREEARRQREADAAAT